MACSEGVAPDADAVSAVGDTVFTDSADCDIDALSIRSGLNGNNGTASRKTSAKERTNSRSGRTSVAGRQTPNDIRRRKVVTLTEKDLDKLKWKRDDNAQIEEHYFFTNPWELISTHMSNEDHWQLMEETVTMAEFEKQAFIRERFYQLGMKMLSAEYDKCSIDSENGETKLEFSLPNDRSKYYSFKYMLYRCDSTAENRTKLDKILDRFVIFEHREDSLSFTFQFPIKGEFKLQMYGLDKNDASLNTYDLICMYALNIKESEKYLPLPDFPAIGWGASLVSQACGVIPMSHKYATITTEDGKLQIVLKAKDKHQLRISLRNPFVNKVNLDNYAMLRSNDDEFVIETRLPQKGSYALKIFAKTTFDSENYQKNRNESTLDGNIMNNVTAKTEVTYPQNNSDTISYKSRHTEEDIDTISLSRSSNNGIGNSTTDTVSAHENVLNYLIRCTGDHLDDEPFPYMRSGKLGKSRWASEIGVNYLGKSDGVVKTVNGYAHFNFEKPDEMVLNCEFYPLRYEHTERIRVTQSREEGKQSFHVDLPYEGNYAMNIFAHNEDNFYEDIYHTHSFIVTSNGRELIFKGKYGQQPKLRQFWQDFPTVNVETIHTGETELYIPRPRGYDKVIAFVLKSESDETMSRRSFETVVESGIPLYKIQLTEKGEYVVDIFERFEKIYLKSIKRYIIYQSATTEKNLDLDELLEVMSLIREERVKAGQDVSELDMKQQTAIDNKVNNIQSK